VEDLGTRHGVDDEEVARGHESDDGDDEAEAIQRGCGGLDAPRDLRDLLQQHRGEQEPAYEKRQVEHPGHDDLRRSGGVDRAAL